MSATGKIKILTAEEKSEGSGARVLRPFPGSQLSHVDPFVLMDEFFVDPSAGFPEHPHRGFEAVTYMLEGGFVHEDSAGNRATVSRGGLQRITMGKGIRHSESPATDGKTHGVQLWVNLPKNKKEVEPGYEIVPEEELPVENQDGPRIKTLIDENSGPSLQTDVEYREIELNNAEFTWRVREDLQGFIYIIDGNGVLKSEDEELDLSNGNAIVKDFRGNLNLSIESTDTLKLISLLGKPHGEPIDMHGPYVD
ncbi:MAG: pirin family protein [Candidatus Bipolaricaulota bacterium]